MHADDEIAYLSAGGLVERYRAGTLSPVEATHAALERLARLEPLLNAFCLVDGAAALEAARRSEVRWRAGAALGPLDGVPVHIKDLLLTQGWPTLRGSRLTRHDQSWDEDAPAVARLREAGAVLLGKTTTPEFGWKALGDSPLTGVTRNPWDLERSPGGSSAGAAAALAAGIGALAIGTDGGGSIRIPAAFCGIVGLKPSFGRVPAYPASAMGLLSHVGPMARSAADLATMLTITARPDSRDPYRLPWRNQDYREGIAAGIEGLRVAASPTLGYARVDPEIAAAFAAAVAAFAELGAAVTETDPGFSDPREAFLVLWKAGAARLLKSMGAEVRALGDPGLAAAVAAGARYSAVDYLEADAARTALGQAMAAFHERFDLLLTPTVAVPALKLGSDLADPAREREWIDWTPFSYPFNLTRQPAVTVPCGLTGAGLPIGLQIVGPLYGENLVLRAAQAFEATQPVRRPIVAAAG